MKFTSSLGSLSTSCLPIETKQQALLELVINAYQPHERAALFQTITDYRRNQLVSIFPEHQDNSFSVLFELMDYRDLVQRYPSTLSADIALLEKSSVNVTCIGSSFGARAKLPRSKPKLHSQRLPHFTLLAI